MNKNNEELTYKKIFIFWIPLALTWLMMSVEGPFLAAIIARLANEKENLAAFGIAFSFGLILESPIIMLMSTSVALVKNNQTYQKLKKFTNVLNFSITFGLIILIIPQVFYFITMDLIGLNKEIAELTHLATILLLPWPAAIGYRRFYQGILIKHGQTKKVTIGTTARLIFMGTTALILYHNDVRGALVGAASLSVGVTMESIATRFMANAIVKDLINHNLEETDETISQKEIIKFYYPLALTPFIALSAQPLVTFFLGKSHYPIESLAVMPVVGSMTFIFRSLGLSFQEVIIALAGEKFKNYKMIRNFSIGLGIFSFIGLAIITFTPLSDIWFEKVAGLNNDLFNFAILPAQIMTFIPPLTVLIAFQRGILVIGKHTGNISVSTTIEVIGIFVIMFIAIKFTVFPGAVIAAAAFLIGRILANIFLFLSCPKVLKEFREG
jgi:O-antigen/teichoic acid export membrane protein